MMMSNLSGEQSIDSSLNLCSSGISSGYKFGKWLSKFFDKLKAERSDSLISDACSAYRGGFVKDAKNPEVNSLMKDLAGTEAARADGNFIFLGDKSDLSYFWKKTPQNQPTVLLKQYIDSIEDEALRSKVTSTMNKARLDGLLTYDGKAFALTSEGKNYILKSDFIVSRLNKETTQLEAAEKAITDDKIDEALKKQGLEGKFENCDRITLNKKILLKGETGDSYSFYVPGTSRKMQVDIPKSNCIELDQNTFVAFLEKGSHYEAANNGRRTTIEESELFKHFDNKNKDFPSDSITTVEDDIPQIGSFDTDEFFKAAFNRSFSDEDTISGTYEVFLSEEHHEVFTIKHSWISEEIDPPTTIYRLSSESGTEINIPKEAFGKIAFKDIEEGQTFVKANPELVKEYQKTLYIWGIETQNTEKEVQNTKEYIIPKGEWSENEDSYSVVCNKKSHYTVEIPKNDAVKLENEDLKIFIHEDKNYKASVGKYTDSVKGQSFVGIIDKQYSLPGKSAVTPVANATAKATQTAAKATQTVSKTLDTVANVIPPVEGVSGAAKAVMKAVAKVGQAVSQTASVGTQGISLSQKI